MFHTVSLSQLIQRGIVMLVRVRALAVAVVSETIVVLVNGGTHQPGKLPARRCILSAESS